MFACGPTSELALFFYFLQWIVPVVVVAPFLLGFILLLRLPGEKKRHDKQFDRLKALAAGYRFDE
jgi:hypothetical protein